MGSDADVFRFQAAAFPDLMVPTWIDPKVGESLESYAERLSREIDPGVPCIVGGLSFGGMLATEVAKHLDAKGCILISTVRKPEELPRRVRLWVALGKFVPMVCIRFGQMIAPFIANVLGPILPGQRGELLRQYNRSSTFFIWWAIRAIDSWHSSPKKFAGKTFQIHGSKDWTIPPSRATEAEIIEGAGHVLTLAHPEEVNSHIRNILSEIEG